MDFRRALCATWLVSDVARGRPLRRAPLLLVCDSFLVVLALLTCVFVGPSRALRRRPSTATFAVEIPVRPRTGRAAPPASGRTISSSAPASPALAACAALPPSLLPAASAAASSRSAGLVEALPRGSPALSDLLAWRAEAQASSLECAVAKACQDSVVTELGSAKAAVAFAQTALASVERRRRIAADRVKFAKRRGDLARKNIDQLERELGKTVPSRRTSAYRREVTEPEGDNDNDNDGDNDDDNDGDDDDEGEDAPSGGARSDGAESEGDESGGDGGDSDEVDAGIAGSGMDLS